MIRCKKLTRTRNILIRKLFVFYVARKKQELRHFPRIKFSFRFSRQNLILSSSHSLKEGNIKQKIHHCEQRLENAKFIGEGTNLENIKLQFGKSKKGTFITLLIYMNETPRKTIIENQLRKKRHFGKIILGEFTLGDKASQAMYQAD